MAVPKHRISLTRKKKKYKINKFFINRSFVFNEIEIYMKLRSNALNMPYYLMNTVSKSFRIK